MEHLRKQRCSREKKFIHSTVYRVQASPMQKQKSTRMATRPFLVSPALELVMSHLSPPWLQELFLAEKLWSTKC